MRPGLSRRARRAMVTTLLLVVIAIAATLVAVSPLALRGLDGAADEWERLSAIGQTYGAASALLAALALIGVALSLWLQQREVKSARDHTLRALHTDLLKMAMDDPVYRRCWGDFFDSADPDAQREHMYLNLVVEHWTMMYEQRAMTEEHLRSLARVVFSAEPGQRYWRSVRDLRNTAVSTATQRRFHEILDEEYHQAPAAPPSPIAETTEEPVPATTEPPERQRWSWGRWLLLGVGVAGAGATVASWLRRARAPQKRR